jgi:outer membrane immunogenic protein
VNKTLIAAAAAIAATTSAMAADMPVKAPVLKAPPAPVVMLWTGGYIGIDGGYSWGRWDTTSTANIFPNGAGGLGSVFKPKVDGWLAGGHVGYNWQFDRNWVFGIEADGQWTGERARTNGSSSLRLTEVGGDFNDVFTTNIGTAWKFPWFATLRGRLGWLADPSLMIYGTGGLAIGEAKFDLASTITCQRFGPGGQGVVPAGTPCNPPPGAPVVGAAGFSDSAVRVGYAVGGGLEKKFSRNWSAKVEYLYVDLGTESFVTGADVTRVRLRDHIARVGISYAFDNTVVAKY